MAAKKLMFDDLFLQQQKYARIIPNTSQIEFIIIEFKKYFS